MGAAFALAAAVGSCGEGEPVSVPIALVPLGVPAGQCVSALQDHLGTPAQVCLYFEGGACVLVADLDAVTTEGCGAEGECALPSGSWSKYCPEGSPGYDLETEAGQSLPASLFVVAGGLADERPSFCTFGGPEESCNGSMDGEAGTNGCLAKIVSEYVVDAETGALTPKADGAVSLTYSGFLVDELGMWGTTDPLCPSIPEGQCPPENASCSPVDLEILVQGSGSGQVRTLPRGTDCDRASCTDSFPRGREVEIEAKADAGAVVASFSAALGAEDGCRDTFVETTTVASCKVTMNGDGQVTVRFGYELSVGVNGLGSVNGSPGGIDGTDISCAGNQSCSEIYDADVTVTLQATSADPDWEFAQWMGGPCDGSQSPTCVVRMDQAQSATALFGYALTIEMVGIGEVTATPPGQTCTTSPCVLTFGSGQSTTLTANPGPNSVFARWSGACASAGTNPTCDLTLDADQSVAVYFAHQVETSAAPNATGAVTRNPVGLACPGRTEAQCGAYEDGDSVTFTGTPATDYVFLAWTGCTATPGTNTCSKSITAPGTVEGTFGRQLDLGISAGLGTIDLAPGVHGTCGAQLATPNTACAAAYAEGTTLTLTANPAAGYAVGPNSWTGCTPRAGNPLLCDVVMDGPRQVALQFGRSLDLQVAGQGTVTSAPTGIDCGTDCGEVFPDGATVTLTATPQGGQAFDAWTGCTPGGNPSVCTVTMNDNKLVTASFGYAIAVTVTGGGTVTSNPGAINCPGTCREVVAGGTAVTLTATPDAQWAFLEWTGCPSVNGNRCTVAANTSANVTAVFGRELTVSLVSPASQGSVTGTGISCGNDCSEVYANGTVVNLTAQPAAGYAVATWLGCSSSNATTCSVSMNNARTVAVAFGPILDVTVTGQGTVNSSPGGISCQSGGAGTCTAAFTQDVVLTAIPDPNWDLLGWSGCTPVAGNPNQCSVAMNQARSVTTQFGRRLQVTVSGSGTVTGTGINCGTDCTEVYAAGASITLTATGQGQSFAGWTGCTTTSGATCNVTMDNAKSVTASFGTATTVIVGSGQGTVVSTPSGIVCGNPAVGGQDCSEAFPNGTSVTLSSTPGTGFAVLGWSGSCTAGQLSPTCVFSASGVAQTVTVDFGRQLTVTTPTNGTVTGSGINCGADCSEVYADGSVVTLTANPASGYVLASWTGCSSSNATTCSVSMNQARNITATFLRPLTVTVAAGSGSTSNNPAGVSCGTNCEAYNNNTTVTITAAPASGWDVLSWTGCTVQANPLQCQVTMSAARNVTVSFGRRLTVTSANGTVSGTGISCGSDCTEVYADGTSVTLNASPNAGFTFTGWTGCSSTAGTQCTVQMNQARSVTATFLRALTVTVAAGNGSTSNNPVGVSCGANCEAYVNNTTVTITATPDAGWAVLSWSGCNVQANPQQCQVTMSAARTVSVSFGRQLTVTTPTNGTITGTGINCGTDCSEVYANNTSVTLTATPNGGYSMGTWTGCNSNPTPTTCQVTMSAARTVSATFGRQLSVTVTGPNGSGNVTANTGNLGTCAASPGGTVCTDALANNTSVTLTAALTAGYVVVWSGCDSNPTATTCQVTMSAAKAVTAQFNPTLTLTIVGRQNNDDITSNPGGLSCANGAGNCNSPQVVSFSAGTSVTITASLGASGSVTWTGDGTPSGLSTQVTLNAPAAVTATFAP